MPSIFQRAALKAGGALDRVFGERFELLPRAIGAGADVNARRVGDTERQAFEFVGAFSSTDGEFHAEGRRMAESATRMSVAPRPIIDVATSALRYLPREGDGVRRVETGEIFHVGRSEESDVGRVRLTLFARQVAAS